MKRCAWCGRFVSATTEPLTFPNAYGKPVIRILCPDDYPVAIGLGQRNLANLRREPCPSGASLSVAAKAAVRAAMQAQEDEQRRRVLNLPERNCFRYYPHRAHEWIWLHSADPSHPGYWCNGNALT